MGFIHLKKYTWDDRTDGIEKTVKQRAIMVFAIFSLKLVVFCYVKGEWPEEKIIYGLCYGKYMLKL